MDSLETLAKAIKVYLPDTVDTYSVDLFRLCKEEYMEATDENVKNAALNVFYAIAWSLSRATTTITTNLLEKYLNIVIHECKPSIMEAELATNQEASKIIWTVASASGTLCI